MDTNKTAQEIFDELKGRGGFDGWWGDMDTETQEEIFQRVVEILDTAERA